MTPSWWWPVSRTVARRWPTSWFSCPAPPELEPPRTSPILSCWKDLSKMSNRIVLAYSGGLDTSVAIGWLAAETGGEIICVAADVGQGGEDLDLIRQRALDCGAVESVGLDL